MTHVVDVLVIQDVVDFDREIVGEAMLRDAQFVADDGVEAPPSGQGAPVRFAVRGGVGEIARAGVDAAERQI